MLTVKQVAEQLKVSENTVRGLCAARQLRHVRIGLGRGRLLIPDDAVEEYVRLKTVEADASKPPPAGVFTH